MADSFDAIVIGGGPGGYNAAIRLGQLGLSAACVDKRGSFGGTCLNVGCIPSKALLHASERFHEAQGDFARLGIKTKVELDLPAMMSQKDKVVSELTRGVEFLFRKNKVEGIVGEARIAAPGKVEVKTREASRSLSAPHIIIATGSDVSPLPGVTIDEKQIVSSTGAIALKEVPRKMLVVGAGIVGLELGSVWRRLGSEVTVVEFLDRVTPGMDLEISTAFQRALQKQGLSFRLSTKVVGVEKTKNGLQVTIEPAAGGEKSLLEADVMLVAVGRRPFTGKLGLEGVGVALDQRGRVASDEHFKTNVPGIYAIGDCREGPMLAHKAEEEAVAVAELIAGKAGHVNYGTIPSVIYTAPEVAAVGKTEEELKEAGIAYKVGKFPFVANARAKTIMATEGFVKMLADATSDRVLGCHILGAEAGNLLAEVVLAMEFGAASEDIARTCHSHPTLSEAVRQAAMAVEGWAMQM
ncbi:MAG: dihydrolipoyl dehydrogenase [Rhizomicrobium sp.]